MRYAHWKYLFNFISFLVLTGCTGSPTGTSSGQRVAGALDPANSISEALLNKSIWGRRYYQMDAAHVCQSESGPVKVPYRRVLEFSLDKQVRDLGDPCEPVSLALPKLGALESSYDGALIGYLDGLYQYSAEPPKEGETVAVEAWCNRTLVTDPGEVAPMDLRLRAGANPGEVSLAWVMVSSNYTSAIVDDLPMNRSESATSRTYTASSSSNHSILEVMRLGDPRKQNLSPALYKMSGEQGPMVTLYCRLAR